MAHAAADTRLRILDAAQSLIQRRGVNAMSFQDLSDAVGIRKASVHHHFATKGAMVSAVLTRYLETFDTAVDQLMCTSGSGRDKLEKYCGLFLNTLQSEEQDKGCLCGMLMVEMASLDASSLALVRRFLQGNTRRVEALLHAGVADGSVVVPGSVPHMARLIVAALEGSLLLSRCDGGPARLGENIAQLIRLIERS